MEQGLSNCPSADGTFLSSTFPNTRSLAAIADKITIVILVNEDFQVTKKAKIF